MLCVVLKVWLATAIAVSYWVVSALLFRYVLGLRGMDAWGALVIFHDPGNSLVISCLIIVEELTYADLVAHYEKFVSCPGTENLRSIFVRVLGHGYWIPDRSFSVSQHIVYYIRKPIHTHEELVNATAEEMMIPLRTDIAAWQALFIPDYDPAKGQSAIIFKLSHAIGDGISLMAIFWGCSTVPPILYKTLPQYTLCQRLSPYLLFPCLIVYSLLTTFSSEDTYPITYHNGKALSGVRVAASAGPYSLREIQEKCKKEGITVNDISCAAMLRTTRKYIEQYCDPPQQLPDNAIIHAQIPFTYRHRDSQMVLSIMVAMYCLSLPLFKGEDPREDLREITAITQRLKAKKCMLLANVAMAILESLIPPDLLYTLGMAWSKGQSLVFTNVPGFKNELTISGKRVVGMHFLSPSMGYNPTVVGITSYNEKMSMLLVSDRNRLEHPDKYAQLFDESLKLYLAI